jgi:glycosyltransferase involved in cell wall biosynthesis
MSAIWVDVTTVLHWARPAVGVVRTEAEFAEYILSIKNARFHFCRFDGIANFIEISPDAVRSALDRINNVTNHSSVLSVANSNTSTIQTKLTTEEKAKIKLFKIISFLPATSQSYIITFFRNNKHASKLFLDKLLKIRIRFIDIKRKLITKTINSTIQLNVVKPTEALSCVFNKDDIYISMGADWNHGDLEYLYNLKKQIGFKAILFCYDVIPIKFPHLTLEWVAERFVRYFSNVAWIANEVICISECSKKDLTNFFNEVGAPIPAMSVVELGCQLPILRQDSISTDVVHILSQKYILFVSSIERRKNHEVLYRAYVRLVDEGNSKLPLLVFVGMPGWGVDDLLNDLRLDYRVKPYIKILNHITDYELSKLYTNSYFTVYPSLYEGWGLPVAESLAYGKFCIASNVASLPEVGGDLIEYLDPWDVAIWASRIMHYVRHPDDLLIKTKRIKNEYISITWVSFASSILETIINIDKQ